MLPGVGFGLLVLSAILIGGVYPALVEQFQVKPNQQGKEQEYIKRNIDATRKAYGVDKSEVIDYTAQGDAEQGQRHRRQLHLRRAAARPEPGRQDLPAEAADSRLLRLPRPARRRPLPGSPTARCATPSWPCASSPARRRSRTTGSTGTSSTPTATASWPRPATRSTPRACPTSTPRTCRSPAPWWIGRSSRSRGSTSARPRARPTTSSSAARGSQELDYPESGGTGQKNTTYDGKGGVPVGSFLNRMLYAAKYGEINLLLSSDVNANSKILYDRNPQERIAKVAPFLTHGRQPLPGHRRRQGGLDRRRVHHLQRLPVLREQEPGGDDARHRHRPAPGGAAAARPDQLHAQLGQGHGRRLRRHRQPVRLGRQGPDPADLAQGVPGRHQAADARCPPSSGSTCATRRRCSRSSATCSRQYHITDPNAFYSGQDFWNVPNDPSQASATSSSRRTTCR